MSRFLIFELNSICYNSYQYFAKSIANELRDTGNDIEIFRGSKENIGELEQFFQQSFTACLDFNSFLPKVMLEDDTFLLDHIDAPFYDFILDHPLYHHDALRRKLKNFHVFCLDQNHKEYIEEYYPHIKTVDVLPMTGEEGSKTDAYKNIDLLFTGTYINPKDILNIINLAPAHISKDVNFLIEQMLKHTEMTQDDALRNLMQNSKAIPKNKFHIFMHSYFLADTFVRAYMREKIIKILIDASIPITLCGSNWDKFEFNNTGLVNIMQSVPYQDTFTLMSQAKILLNIMPLFKAGTHDRIFSAMFNKCVSLTDSSTYLNEIFCSNENIVFYDLNHLELLPGMVTALLQNSEKLNTIVENGYYEVKQKHTWKNRVEKMLQDMQFEK